MVDVLKGLGICVGAFITGVIVQTVKEEHRVPMTKEELDKNIADAQAVVDAYTTFATVEQ